MLLTSTCANLIISIGIMEFTETLPSRALDELMLSDSERNACVEVISALRAIRFGSIQIVVHDRQVVEIQKMERIRPGARCRS